MAATMTETDRAAQIRRQIAELQAELAALETRTGANLTGEIRAIYTGWRRGTDREWMSLAELRERMSGTRAQQDAALREIAMQPGVHVIPVANMKSLTRADRDAALRLGGEDNHAIMIES